ncbi:hypothetical protein AAFF_G00227170 [Aldrovandia affinis]|uniref:Uncharacterized protein n=1 Tax=Aldrovandia affinis TaxID=143900 RepID=A0AAD7TBG4_9TELE|nr:hypothetical protein AAFF_G00227170 [Aldrovandia affinis]
MVTPGQSEGMDNLRHVLLLLVQIANTISQDENTSCHEVLNDCDPGKLSWTRCYEGRINQCIRRPSPRRGDGLLLEFYQDEVDTNSDVEHTSGAGHFLHLPSEVLRRSTRTRGPPPSTTKMTVTVFNSSLFRAQVWPNETILGGMVLGVMVGKVAVKNLNQPVRMSFRHTNETGGRCVFYEESEDNNGTGRWSMEGCTVSRTNKTFNCSCDHLSFFAVLVNTDVFIDPVNAHSLSYITYIGCGLSLFFTALAIILNLYLRRKRSEQTMVVHLNLKVALSFLHLFFLLSAWWAGQVPGHGENGAVCQALALLLHYSLLATFTWMAIESFHLYLLLVRVFNIYIKRYLVKLGLVGWGVPMVIVIACALTRTYGGYSLQREENSGSSTGNATDICWIRNKTVSYITVSGYLGLVFLFSTLMLTVMVVKFRKVRGNSVRHQEKRRLWRDCVTVLGMACVLGVPWGLAFITYGPLPLPGLYLFTILNSLQGVFMFLWFLALTWQSCREKSSVGRDPSTQKMETSFKN